jgi:DNA repair protein RadC
VELTKRLKAVLHEIDVRVLDHVVVGDNRCVSFADRGLL